jgi:hypothetical protein
VGSRGLVAVGDEGLQRRASARAKVASSEFPSLLLAADRATNRTLGENEKRKNEPTPRGRESRSQATGAARVS